MIDRIESGSDKVVLTLRGILDGQGTAAIRDGLEEISAAANRDVVLDFSSVTYMDGSGVTAIAYVFKRLMAKGRTLTIIGVTGQPAQLLREMGLNNLFALAGKVPRRPLFSRPGWALAR